MKKKIGVWICNLGLKFLNWGEANFGSESHEDWKWLQKSRAEFKAMKSRFES